MKNRLVMVVVIVETIFSASLFGGVYVKFDPQGGTFAVAGVTMEVGSIPDEVIMEKGHADPVRIGYYFAGWSSIAHPKDEAELDAGFAAYYATPVTKATTFYAIWEQYEPWHDDNGRWWRDGDMLCGRLTNSSSSTSCAYEVPGRGWLSFKWRMVDAANPEVVISAHGYAYDNPDYAIDPYFYCYGYGEPYGEGDWQTVRVAIAEVEPSDFVWELRRYSYYGDVDAILQIADITWESADSYETTVVLEPGGGTLSEGNEVVRKGKYGDLPMPVRSGCDFLGWSSNPPNSWGNLDESARIMPETTLPFAPTCTVYAVWNVPREVAVDPESTLSGRISFADVPWYVQPVWTEVLPIVDYRYRSYSFSGEMLSCSSSEADSELPKIVVHVDGCGILDVDKSIVGRIKLDGLIVGTTSAGETPIIWGGEINAKGSHTIEFFSCWVEPCCDMPYWAFQMGPLKWKRVESLSVRFDARGGVIEGPVTRTYAVGEPYGSFPSVSRPGYEFLGWFTEPDGGTEVEYRYVFGKGLSYEFKPVSAYENVRVSSSTLYARWRSDAKTALGGGKLRFATKDEWVGQSDLSHDGDCASAGTTLDVLFGRTNSLSTVVQGDGMLTFWWMQGDDFAPNVNVVPTIGTDRVPASLMIWLDGRLVASCPDCANWQYMSLPITGKGNHVVEWRFTPGGSGLSSPIPSSPIPSWLSAYTEWEQQGYWQQSWTGSMLPYLFNRVERAPMRPGAWIDEVRWTPAGEVTDIVTWAMGLVSGQAWLLNALPAIEANYTRRLADEPWNYELLILRAFTKLLSLGESENLKAVLSRFGFAPDYQVLGHFFGELDYFDAPLSNEVVDELAAEAVPVLESALADLEAIPDDWTGSIPLDPATYPVDVVTHVDLADVTLCKAILKGALSALAIAEGYDLSVDYMNAEMEEILAEAGLKPTFEYVVIDHPEFAKRVRDAERLGEGKEILRDALETLQDFDRLMQARSTAEMHFFEYDAADADEQQYARDEVAKLLVSLDGEVVVNNDDFRYDGDFRIENLRQPVTLVPFFAGELTRRYLPTEINGNVPVFDSFPNMAFGGTFPGLTKDIVAGWLAAYDCEVDYTPNSDYEPEVKFRTFNSAIPNLGLSATPEEINDALAGTADAKVKANIADATSYAAYETWATKVRSSGVPLKTVKASPCSWQSFALATPELMQAEITDDDLKVEEFKPSFEAGKFDFTVSVRGVTVGSEAVGENLEQVIGLEGATSLGEGFKPENVAVKFAQPEDGKLKFTAEPKDKSVKSFFMRMKAR